MLIATLMENSWLEKTLGSLKRRKCNFHRNFLNYVVFHLPSQEIYKFHNFGKESEIDEKNLFINLFKNIRIKYIVF